MRAMMQHKTREFTSAGNPVFKGKGKFPYIGDRGIFPFKDKAEQLLEIKQNS